MDMKRSDEWMPDTAFEQALDRNAAAKLLVMAMGERRREELRQRARGVQSPAEMDAFVDSLLGGQSGHPPYQL